MRGKVSSSHGWPLTGRRGSFFQACQGREGVFPYVTLAWLGASLTGMVGRSSLHVLLLCSCHPTTYWTGTPSVHGIGVLYACTQYTYPTTGLCLTWPYSIIQLLFHTSRATRSCYWFSLVSLKAVYPLAVGRYSLRYSLTVRSTPVIPYVIGSN